MNKLVMFCVFSVLFASGVYGYLPEKCITNSGYAPCGYFLVTYGTNGTNGFFGIGLRNETQEIFPSDIRAQWNGGSCVLLPNRSNILEKNLIVYESRDCDFQETYYLLGADLYDSKNQLMGRIVTRIENSPNFERPFNFIGAIGGAILVFLMVSPFLLPLLFRWQKKKDWKYVLAWLFALIGICLFVLLLIVLTAEPSF